MGEERSGREIITERNPFPKGKQFIMGLRTKRNRWGRFSLTGHLGPDRENIGNCWDERGRLEFGSKRPLFFIAIFAQSVFEC